MPKVMELTEQVVATIKDAARKLAGAKRRAFQAGVAVKYLGGSSRRAERVFGWGRETVEKGLAELRTGVVCLGAFSLRGNKKAEAKNPKLEQDIRELAEPHSQQDPQFKAAFKYCKITAAGMRKALIELKGWTKDELPHVRTIGKILNRLGYKLRRVQKSKPLKKIPETDAIFDNVESQKKASQARPDSLLISMDTKAKVDIGEFSRRGVARGQKAVKALDHDTQSKKKRRPSASSKSQAAC